jgi:acyl dehydratase
VEPDAQGRLVVQGLLTATMPTKGGGDINFIARKAAFEFLRPVFTGDTILCENTIQQMEEQADRIYMEVATVCRNQLGKEVLTGTISGLIRK